MACTKSFDDNKIFMKVIGVRDKDVRNWTKPPRMCQKHQVIKVNSEKKADSKPCISTEQLVGVRTEKGYLVSLNDQLIALFKVQGKLYAVRDSCPHSGGPLSMGDIEELPGEGLCIRCPWHQWKILLDSGNIGEHKGRKETATTYPVQVNGEGDIYIGFSQLSPKFFKF